MSDSLSQTISSAVETIEWRLARQEDGPVWVALTREGRAPLLPREALTEPTRRLVQDRREREEELHYFLSELPRHSGECFLLWHAGSVVGRVCFTVKENEAYIWGLALLPTLKVNMVARVVQSIIAHAGAAGVAYITAVFEASHLPVFKAEGFGVVRRYSTIVSATAESEENDEESGQQWKKKKHKSKKNIRHLHIRQMKEEDLLALSEEKRASSAENGKHAPVQAIWHEEISQLMRGQGDKPLDDCTYVAEGCPEGESRLRLLGAIQVSQWRRIAVITDLFVSRRQRRSGIGKALVDRARERLVQRNYATIMATINEQSRAQRFFRHVGFRDVQQCTIVARLKLPPQRQPRIAGT